MSFAPVDDQFTPPPPPDIEDPWAGLDDAFNQVEAKESPEYDDLPDGKYQAFSYAVKPFTIEKGKRVGYQGINIQLRVLSGPHRGFKQSFMRSFHRDDPDSLAWLKKDLTNLGVVAAMQAQQVNLGTLMRERLDLFLDHVVEIQVKRTPGRNAGDPPYVNVYINRTLDGVAIPEDLRYGADGAGAASSGGGGQPDMGF